VSVLLLSPELGDGRWGVPTWVAAVLLVAQLLPLAWRRTSPHTVMGIVGTATGVYFAFGFPYAFNVVGVIVALHAEAAYGLRRRSGLASLGISLAVIVAIVLANEPSLSGEALPVYAFNVFVFVTAWATGDAVRSRRLLEGELRSRADQAERSREVEAERAVLAERSRIARELHDLIAHTVSVMVVQAGGGRRAAEHDPDRGREALGAIETTGRSALTELRRLVDVLRDGDDGVDLVPQPGLDEVEALVTRLADAGVPVELTTEGTPRPVPRSVGVSTYRIVQEALTNVCKHAAASRVRVCLARCNDDLSITVDDDGVGVADQPEPGNGLIGMRERIAMHHGTLQTGPGAHGGFVIRARLPIPAAR
jgi:signal transduction histidine kinase